MTMSSAINDNELCSIVKGRTNWSSLMIDRPKTIKKSIHSSFNDSIKYPFPFHFNRTMSSSKLISIIFLTLSTLIISISCEKCDEDDKCLNVEQWRSNILCRIRGGPDTVKNRTNGYIEWAMDHKAGEDQAIRNVRFNSMRYYIEAEHELITSFPNRRPRDRVTMLERYERGINDVGVRLATALKDQALWETSSTTMCGIRTKRNTPCGQRDTDNEPTLCSTDPFPEPWVREIYGNSNDNNKCKWLT